MLAHRNIHIYGTLYGVYYYYYFCVYIRTSILSTLPTSSHSVNHPSSFISLELNNAPPPNLVLVYVTVWEVQPGSLKWQGLNVPRQSGYVPGRTAW